MRDAVHRALRVSVFCAHLPVLAYHRRGFPHFLALLLGSYASSSARAARVSSRAAERARCLVAVHVPERILLHIARGLDRVGEALFAQLVSARPERDHSVVRFQAHGALAVGVRGGGGG